MIALPFQGFEIRAASEEKQGRTEWEGLVWAGGGGVVLMVSPPEHPGKYHADNFAPVYATMVVPGLPSSRH